MTLRAILIGAAILVATLQPALAGTVSGRVVDENGDPASDVTVEVVYQTYNADDLSYGGKSIKQTAISGADGRYEISTERMPPGIYSANAYRIIRNGTREINLAYRIDEEETFGSHESVVRNFTGGFYESTETDPYGNGGVFVLERAIEADLDLGAAEVTLTHVETGKTIVRAVRPTGEGLVVTGIPFGTYRAEVSLDGRPLQLSLMGPGIDEAFGPSVTHDFTMGWLENQMRVMAKP